MHTNILWSISTLPIRWSHNDILIYHMFLKCCGHSDHLYNADLVQTIDVLELSSPVEFSSGMF